MNTLEELYYGNIQPMEVSHIEKNAQYKEALNLVNSNYDRLQEGLTEKQKELLMRYAESRNEFSNITELDAFKTGFKLGAGLVIEVLH
ncbi:MAG: hypothetical protein IJI67_01805 [Clostridia bacterium]|nr:hypothetical protein [Clostridia bacterium]